MPKLLNQRRARRAASSAGPLVLSVAGCVVRIACRSPGLRRVLLQSYGAMRRRGAVAGDMNYIVRRRGRSCILRSAGRALRAMDDGEFIFRFEKDLTLALQRRRRDLYFVHAAAVEFAGKGIVLAAPSGGGKSTLTWALLHRGFGYLSDELAPIDLTTWRICPYPHALCLKQEPPQDFPLPAATLRTRRTLHVPTTALPSRTLARAVPLRSIIFLEYSENETGAALQAISKAEATARLFAQALNPLAHAEDGLGAAAAIAGHAACYRLRFRDLSATCDLLANCLSAKF